VETVTASQDALSAFEPGKFDLIITDYEMPVMKGDQLAAAMRALAPQQRILMITAYGEHLRLSGDFPLAVDLVMSKPFDVQKLRSFRFLAPFPSPWRFGHRLKFIAQRVNVAALQTVLLSLPLTRPDQVFQAARAFRSRRPAFSAPFVAPHAHLIFPLP